MSGIFKVQSFELNDLFNAPGETAFSSSELRQAESYMRDHKALGANTVTIGWGVPIDMNTGKRVAGFTVNNEHEASFDEIRQLASYAKSIGLDVILKPQSQTMGPTGSNGSLTDNVNAGSVAAYSGFSAFTFLKDWATYMGQVGSLAQEIGAKQVVIGTENSGFDSSQYRTQWQNVINETRAHYSGPLSYDALYPLQQQIGVDKVGFWDLLDVIGVSAYYPLSSNPNPTYQDVLAGWYANTIFPNNTGPKVNVVETLHNISLQYGKPVEFAEFGGQSFHGVVNDPSGSGIANKTADWQQQAWLYQSFFEAFSSNNASGWFQGVNTWGQSLAPGQDESNFATYVATAGSMNFDIRAKDAGKVVAAWFGATNYLAYTDISWAGSMANDRVALYGSQTGASSKQHQSDTYGMTVSLAISGTIINGKTPTLHFYINGTDYGAAALDNAASGYVDAAGVPWTPQQTFKFTLPAATAITELKVVMDSPVNVGGVENSQTFLASAAINGVALTNVSYTPAGGSVQQQTVGAGGQWNGGYSIFDASPWNTQLASRTIGTAANPMQIDGGDGADTVSLLGKASQYTISSQSGKNSVTVSESSGLNQNAVLKNVEKLQFSDMTVNLTVGASAKSIAETSVKTIEELYVAFFNRVPDADGLEYWIGQFKNGQSLNSIADSFYGAAVFFSSLTGYSSTMTNDDFVKVIYKNVLGRSGATAPPDADVNYWTGELASGRASKGSLIATMLTSAHSFKGDATWGWVANLLDNKVAVADYFAVQHGLGYVDSNESITKGMAIAAAVTPTATSEAIALIGMADTGSGMA